MKKEKFETPLGIVLGIVFFGLITFIILVEYSQPTQYPQMCDNRPTYGSWTYNQCCNECNSLGKQYWTYKPEDIFNGDECWCLNNNNDTMRIR